MPLVEDDDQIREILKTARTIAVVGLSDKPWRDSNTVSAFMLSHGYTIIPVNPNVRSALGIQAVASLSMVEGGIDIVNVFRKAEFVPEIVDAAIAIKVRTLWLQTGIVHDQAATRAAGAGMNVIVDRCIRVAYSLLLR